MKRILELEKLITHHKALYYQGRPEITDHEFDALEEELRIVDPGNLALELVGNLSHETNKVGHEKKMLSLNKTYKIEELKQWISDRAVVSMYKIDGVSCSLVYEKGSLVLAKTRGDGMFGENITRKVMWMDSIPKKISTDFRVEIRGELFCTEEDFFHLSEKMVSLELDRPSSQRNIVAGLISRKDHLELCRYLSFKGFDILCDEMPFQTEMEKIFALKDLGIDVLEVELHRDLGSVERVISLAQAFMSEGEYQIDGLVFSYNDLSLHVEMGETAHHPRYKMALKFEGESKVSIIEKITWSVSRNGILTPVANVKPVSLSGATISRVTLHNYGMVKQYNLKPGDQIEIIRSGEVIPKFLQVLEASNNPLEFPSHCPSCQKEVFVEDIRLVCKNDACPAIILSSILNFVQKIGIEDISTRRLEEMIQAGLVRKVEDLYQISEGDFLKLDKVKEKLAAKMFQSINNSKKADLVTFLSALGISGGAYNKCEKVVNAGFNSIDKIISLTEEELVKVESFAEKSAKEFIAAIEGKREMITTLQRIGFSFAVKELGLSPLAGKTICITGALSEKRSVIESWIREASGSVSSSVSKKTDYLVTNENDSASSKFKKAMDLGISVLSEAELKALLQR